MGDAYRRAPQNLKAPRHLAEQLLSTKAADPHQKTRRPRKSATTCMASCRPSAASVVLSYPEQRPIQPQGDASRNGLERPHRSLSGILAAGDSSPVSSMPPWMPLHLSLRMCSDRLVVTQPEAGSAKSCNSDSTAHRLTKGDSCTPATAESVGQAAIRHQRGERAPLKPHPQGRGCLRRWAAGTLEVLPCQAALSSPRPRG